MLNSKRQRKTDFVGILIIVYLITSLLFASSDVLEEASKTLPIVVPYLFNSSIEVIKYAIILFAFIGAFIKKGNLKLDGIAIALLFRVMIGCLQIFRVIFVFNDEPRLGNYFLWLLDFLIYVMAYNALPAESFLKMTYIFSLVISIEVIIQAILGVLPYVPYSEVYYKACLHIPIGSSNYLSTIVLPFLLASIMSCKEKNGIWYCCTLIQVIGVLLTKSRAGMLLLACGLLLLFIKHFRNMKKWVVVVLPLLTFFAVYFIVRYQSEIVKVLSGYASVVSTGGLLNKLSSGRMDSIRDILDNMVKCPILGYGPNYKFSRPHNIVIDLLYQNGIIGLIVFAVEICGSLKKVNLQKKRSITNKYASIAVTVYVVNSFTEISILNSLLSDLMFFSLLSIVVNENNKNLQDNRLEAK